MSTTKHLVDPALVPMLDQLPEVQFSSETLPLIRAERLATQAQEAANAPVFPDITVTRWSAPGPDGAPTELHVYPGAYHGYQWAPDAWMSQAEERNTVDALRRALRP